MKLRIEALKGSGTLKDERLLLRVTEDTDVGEYLVADTTYKGDGRVSNKLRHVFWLPDREVSAGDLVVVYTKSGQDKSRDNQGGNTTHFLYWGLERTVWNNNEDAVTLFHISQWKLKRVET